MAELLAIPTYLLALLFLKIEVLRAKAGCIGQIKVKVGIALGTIVSTGISADISASYYCGAVLSSQSSNKAAASSFDWIQMIFRGVAGSARRTARVLSDCDAPRYQRTPVKY